MTPDRDFRQLVICGSTASGKSDLSDYISESISSDSVGTRTILFDSMQVYRELPVISNQRRRLPAELAGIVSVADYWSAAHHKEAAEKIIRERPDTHDARFILEAGTGMYLNVFMLDVDMAPRVSPEFRREAERRVEDGSAASESNPRRAVRAEELRLSGIPEDNRGSIWDGDLRSKTSLIYLKPERHILDNRIKKRSGKIVSEGMEEASHILELSRSSDPKREYPESPVSKTVLDSIGVRELIEVVQGTKTPEEAEERIAIRTRQLARRQMRWFDKLLSEISADPKLHSMKILPEIPVNDRNTMLELDDIIGWWMD